MLTGGYLSMDLSDWVGGMYELKYELVKSGFSDCFWVVSINILRSHLASFGRLVGEESVCIPNAIAQS
ncbi:MAG: hypothetical protein KME16_25360 [Scytolyngbya sp. HA4215-MV1]|nr:hypothetical protein [Scytolyngbya sp. HA4215-MV1]